MARRIGNEDAFAFRTSVQVAEWSLKRPAAEFERGSHPGLRPPGLLVVVELANGSEQVSGEIPDRVVAERLVH
ncbi:MAG TPA: hypothetical protein VIK60_06485 [Vicinamibacterales bacterium]